MSDSCLVEWFESLLFGRGYSCPPHPLQSLVLQLESENIPWSHLMETGGLAEFPHDVHGDLNTLIDYLEWCKTHPDEEPLPPRPFKTRAVSRFWDDLQLLLARQEPTPAPKPSQSDDETLQQLLEGTPGPLRYESAEFWGDVARRFIHLRRVAGQREPVLPACSSKVSRRVLQLYQMTCYARGQCLDPFNLHLVPHSEYVNAVHWQNDTALEAFLLDRPKHPLSLCVRQLLSRTVDHILRAEKPPILAHARLDTLFDNVKRIHEQVEQVHAETVPPRLVDVLHRLVALAKLDGLWEKDEVEVEPSNPLMGTTLMYLTEQLRIAERERRFLLTGGSESCPKPPGRTCPLYGKGRG